MNMSIRSVYRSKICPPEIEINRYAITIKTRYRPVSTAGFYNGGQAIRVADAHSPLFVIPVPGEWRSRR